MKYTFRMAYNSGAWALWVILFAIVAGIGAMLVLLTVLDAGEKVAVYVPTALILVGIIGGLAFGSVPVEVSLWQEGIRIQALRRFHPYPRMNRMVEWHTIERASVLLPDDNLAPEEATLTVVVGGYSFGLKGPAAEVESMRSEAQRMMDGMGRAGAVAPGVVSLQEQLGKSKAYQWVMWASAAMLLLLVGTGVLSLFGVVEGSGPFPWGRVVSIGIVILVPLIGWSRRRRRGGDEEV